MTWQKAHGYHGSVGMHRAFPGAMCVYQMFPLLGLPLRHIPSSNTQGKDLKYCLICIFDREHKCSSRRFVSQIMLFLPLFGIKEYFPFFLAKCSCKNIVLTLYIT